MWLKAIFLVIPFAVQCWLPVQHFYPPSPKSDTADRHLQEVIDWLCISTSSISTSKILKYPWLCFWIPTSSRSLWKRLFLHTQRLTQAQTLGRRPSICLFFAESLLYSVSCDSVYAQKTCLNFIVIYVCSFDTHGTVTPSYRSIGFFVRMILTVGPLMPGSPGFP